ncbi:MAG: helix-turn-helix domain-containing protein [Clostridia bacterium]|nr:helix-turn-helix domain-containing protein [Clostridia bacterium]
MNLGHAKQQLLEQLLDDSTLIGLLEKCAQLLGSPLRFTFQSGPDGFLISEGYPYTDVIQSQIEIARYACDTSDKVHYLMERFNAEHGVKPFLVVPETPNMSRRMVCVVSANERVLGLLTLPEYRCPLEEISQPLMTLCARCIGFRMLQSLRDSTFSSIQQSMHILLSLRSASYSDIVHAAGGAALPRKGEYRLMTIRQPEGDDTQQIAVLGGQAARLLSTEWYAFQKQEAAVLYKEAHAAPSVNQRISLLLEISSSCACVSPVFHDLMEAALWRKRMIMLPAFQKAAPGSLTFFEEWLDWGLFGETPLEPAQMEAFIPRPILAIRDWDRTHGTAYLATISALVHHNGRRKQTAAALKTHVNTINYRLAKIEELFGLNLHDTETPYCLFFGVRLMEYLNQLAGDSGRE